MVLNLTLVYHWDISMCILSTNAEEYLQGENGSLSPVCAHDTLKGKQIRIVEGDLWLVRALDAALQQTARRKAPIERNDAAVQILRQQFLSLREALVARPSSQAAEPLVFGEKGQVLRFVGWDPEDGCAGFGRIFN